MFFAEPVCNGKHGWNCGACMRAKNREIKEREARLADVRRINAIPHPWDLAA